MLERKYDDAAKDGFPANSPANSGTGGPEVDEKPEADGHDNAAN